MNFFFVKKKKEEIKKKKSIKILDLKLDKKLGRLIKIKIRYKKTFSLSFLLLIK